MLEGQRDLVSRLVMGITGLTICLQEILTYLLSPPDPPSILSTKKQKKTVEKTLGSPEPKMHYMTPRIPEHHSISLKGTGCRV